MNFFGFDLADILSFTVSPLELMLRGTLMYWFLFIVFRFILRRDVGSLEVRQEGIEDIATVKLMFLEADGEMSLIRKEGTGSAA